MSTTRSILGGLVAATCLAVTGAATAQSFQGTAGGVAPLLRGTTHCTDGTSGTADGVVVVHASAARNVLRVRVVLLHGVPNQSYYVAIACQRQIGTLATNANGNGVAIITTSAPPSRAFFVDLGIGDGSLTGTTDYRIAGPFSAG